MIIITYIRLAKLKIAHVGGGSPKKESSNGLMPNIVRIIKIVKSRKITCLRSPRSIHSSGDFRQTTKAIRLKAEKGSRDV